MSCPHCPHCIAAGAFGVIDPSDPALTTNQPKKVRLHKATSGVYLGECGTTAFRYKDRRSGSGVDDWNDVTCPRCLAKRLLPTAPPSNGAAGTGGL
ncbi:MAG: hypothetical protein V4510_09745 [bacterium]